MRDTNLNDRISAPFPFVQHGIWALASRFLLGFPNRGHDLGPLRFGEFAGGNQKHIGFTFARDSEPLALADTVKDLIRFLVQHSGGETGHAAIGTVFGVSVKNVIYETDK
jgi:hypothetical protein